MGLALLATAPRPARNDWKHLPKPPKPSKLPSLSSLQRHDRPEGTRNTSQSLQNHPSCPLSPRYSEEREGSLDGFGGFGRCFESLRAGRGAVARRERAAWMVLEALGGVSNHFGQVVAL